MKKITLLIALVFTSSLMFAQVVLTEDFEAGLTVPAGWTNNDIAGGGEIWTFETGGEAVGFNDPNTIYYANSEMEGNYAIFDSDGYGGAIAEDSALESPVFSCVGLTAITLSFNNGFTTGYGGQGFVEVSSDGAAWTQVASYGAANAFGFESIDVSAQLANIATAQVRFRWVGDFAWGWAFDNVSVFQCTVNVPDPVPSAITPLNGATDVEINYGTTNNINPFEWNEAEFGGAADTYNISLGETMTGDDIGTISGFDSGGGINFGWLPNTTYYWFIEAVNCAGVTAGPIWSFTTSACTDVAAPGATNTPLPADSAIDVSLSSPDSSTIFSWTGPDPNADYTLNLGTTNPPTQPFNNFVSGDPITGLAVNTTYFWSVDAVNCFGTTPGPVWSFTTAAELSIEDNELNTFSVYPNPTSDVLNIKSSKEIDNITVFNLLGQNVASFKKNDITNSSIDLAELSNGLYLVKISAGDTTQTIRVTKD
ncbi:T9SS type A sorting domain-containing protein [Winogradskyella sp.]|uniref:T9SS type A sorting domain-containing protein n=1 Tax=Winogradskyella sp. TaxID=1883156 RepID=UPI0025FAB7A8|nr:T9SS type A sorting domain-containing protein [Winogradskyella sp.]